MTKMKQTLDVNGFSVRMEIPKSIYDQNDMQQLLAVYYSKGTRQSWREIREIILENLEITKNGIVISPEGLSLVDLNGIVNAYIKNLVLPFFQETMGELESAAPADKVQKVATTN